MTTSPSSSAPRSMPFPAGTVLAGKYRVERLLGEGGMGWVVVATHMHLEQRVAIKFMHPEQVTDHPDAVARFLREARAAARIQSEHVARVSDVGTLDNGAPYLVMEYLEGQDLEGLLRTQKNLPPEQVIDYVLQACEGLAEAHAKGIVHRDLKPANLFLARRSDGSPRVKLLDFGISKIAPASGSTDAASMTSTQALMGSPLYMSPEQLRSSKKVDRRADLWSMGIILYEMLSGNSPFDAETLPEVCSRIMVEPPPPLTSVRPELSAVVMRCLEKEPQNRYPDVGALAQALAPFGPPDSRALAERIARVVRSGGASLPDIAPDASGPLAPLTAAAASGVAQTSASFGTVATAAPKRSPALPLLLGGGATVIVALVIGVVASRGHREQAPITAESVAAPPLPASNLGAPAAAPLPTASVEPVATASDAPFAAASAPSATVAPAATATAPTARPTPQRPKPSPAGTAAAPTAKPAGTNAFGGRD